MFVRGRSGNRNEEAIRQGVPQQFVWAFSSPQLAIRLGLWAGLGVLVPRKYLVRDAISTKHTYNHYGQSSVGGILYLFTFWAFWAFLDLVNRNSAALFRSLMRSCMRSLCLHSRHTNILHTRHNRSTASPPPSSHKAQAPRGPSSASGDGARCQAPELPRARPTGQGPSSASSQPR